MSKTWSGWSALCPQAGWLRIGGFLASESRTVSSARLGREAGLLGPPSGPGCWAGLHLPPPGSSPLRTWPR